MQLARAALLDQALALSVRMHDLGVEEHWEEVVELESQRRELLEQAFATRAPVDEALAQRVRKILELDKAIVAHSLETRDRVGEQLGLLNKGRKVARAYKSA